MGKIERRKNVLIERAREEEKVNNEMLFCGESSPPNKWFFLSPFRLSCKHEQALVHWIKKEREREREKEQARKNANRSAGEMLNGKEIDNKFINGWFDFTKSFLFFVLLPFVLVSCLLSIKKANGLIISSANLHFIAIRWKIEGSRA